MSLIDDIEQSIIQRFCDTGLSCEIIEQTAQLIIEDIQRSAGGSDAYVAQMSRKSRKKRRNLIREDWRNGCDIKTISKKYSLDITTIYKIIGKKINTSDDFSSEEWRL